jgi:hypothetical protein
MMALVTVTPSGRSVRVAWGIHGMQCPINPGQYTNVRSKARDTARFGRIDRALAIMDNPLGRMGSSLWRRVGARIAR